MMTAAFQSVAEVGAVLDGVAVPWAICGGWAIDLWLNREQREHTDVDVAIYRSHQDPVRQHLESRGWTLTIAHDGDEVGWAPGEQLQPPFHAVWCRHPTASPSRFEILLNEREGDEFVFRRDPRMRMPANRAMRPTVVGPRVLSPAIVLLYKAKSPTPRDTAELHAAAAILDPDDREWLLRGLSGLSPEHPWIKHLSA